MTRKIPSTERPAPVASPILRSFGEIRFNTDGEIMALGFGSDDVLWSVEDAGVLRKWSAVTGQQIGWETLSELETLWSFSGDGRLLASASDELSLWEVGTGRKLFALPQPSWVTAIAYSRDARLVATGHDDGAVRIWDPAAGKKVCEFQRHRLSVSAVAFSPDGARLATAGEDRIIALWDARTCDHLGDCVGHTDRIQALAWHPRGHRIVSAGWDTTARVWDTATFEPVILLNAHADQVMAMTFSRDGSLLACADSANAIYVWDPETFKILSVLKDHHDEIRCLAFSPDGSRLASGGNDRVVHLWDPRRSANLDDHGQPILTHASISVSPDGKRLASTCGGASLQVWDTATGKTALHPELPEASEPPQLATFSPDGRWLGAGTEKVLRVWDAHTGKLARSLEGQRGRVVGMVFTPDGNLLASASDIDGLVWVWNLATSEPVLVIPDSADNCMVEAMAFHPNGQVLAVGGIDWMATGGSDGAVCLWDVIQRLPVFTFDGGTRALAFHPAGRHLACSTLEDTILVWDLDTRVSVAELSGHDDVVTCVAYSPNGLWLASGSDDRSIRLWNTTTHEPAATLEFDTQIKAIAFSPDGRFLYTGNGNTTSYQVEVQPLLVEGSQG